MPVDALWQVFADVPGWPRWNACFRWVRATELREGATLVWVFGPVRPWLPYRLPAVARLIHVEPRRRVTWKVDLPGFHPVLEVLAGAARLPRRGVRIVAYGRPSELPPLVVVPGLDGSAGSVAPVGDGRDHPLFDAVRDSSPEDARTRTGWEVGRDVPVELSALAATGVAALVLVGGTDRFVPDVASVTARLRSLFGPSAVHVVPGAGHVAPARPGPRTRSACCGHSTSGPPARGGGPAPASAR